MNSDREKSNFQSPEEKNKHPKAVSTAAIPQIPNKTTTPIVTFTGRKKRFRFSFRRLIMPLFSLFLAFLLLSFYAEHLLADRFEELAKSQAEKQLLQILTNTVEQMARDGLLSYSAMVKTIRDPSGEVIYLEVDTALLAQASARLVQKIDLALAEQKRIT
ncbi:MAG: hypothetical protein IJC26_05665, partial [Clostridia bacterium]|nr:hypothetical protein [Clostridia bacterium]